MAVVIVLAHATDLVIIGAVAVVLLVVSLVRGRRQ
jgi:hypothetical protein